MGCEFQGAVLPPEWTLADGRPPFWKFRTFQGKSRQRLCEMDWAVDSTCRLSLDYRPATIYNTFMEAFLNGRLKNLRDDPASEDSVGGVGNQETSLFCFFFWGGGLCLFMFVFLVGFFCLFFCSFCCFFGGI